MLYMLMDRGVCRFVYAPHRPEVSGQNQFMKWPTTMTFQFVNPTVGIVLTNTNFTDLGESQVIPEYTQLHD